MTDKLNDVQRYYSAKDRAVVKAKLHNVIVNGKPATLTFTEYEAPEADREEFGKYDGSDGHYYFLVVTLVGRWSIYYNCPTKLSQVYLTSKEEGNRIYKTAKTDGFINF